MLKTTFSIISRFIKGGYLWLKPYILQFLYHDYTRHPYKIPPAIYRWLQTDDGQGWRWHRVITFILLILNIITTIIFFTFHPFILMKMQQLASFIKAQGTTGRLILSLTIAITAFPPIHGYGMMLNMAGFVYGFPWGFGPAFIGAMMGSCACFILSRKYARGAIDGIIEDYRHLTTVVQLIEKRGFKLLVGVRFAPYPFTAMNFLLATATSISFHRFAGATAISLIKLLTHVLVGSQLHSFSQSLTSSDPKDALTWGQYAVIGMTVGLGIGSALGVGWYFMGLVNQELLQQDGINQPSLDTIYNANDDEDVEAGLSDGERGTGWIKLVSTTTDPSSSKNITGNRRTSSITRHFHE